MDPKSKKYPSREGQAMAEFLVGLVSVMLLVVGLQQISILSASSFKAYSNVRRDLAEQVSDQWADYGDGYVFSSGTDPGADLKMYTGDDRIVASDESFYREYLERTHYPDLETELNDYDRVDPFYGLDKPSFMPLGDTFTMFYSEDQQMVEVVPFLRRVMGRDTVNLKQYGWMPALDGLMDR